MKGFKKFLLDSYIHTVRMIHGVDKNKVVFISFDGKAYSDNPKAVSEELHRQKPDTRIVWLFREPKKKQTVVPNYVKCAAIGKPFELYVNIATASVVLSNFSLYDIPKNKKQLFIQTWHGDKAFKTVLHDSPGSSPDRIVAEQREGFCDLAVAGSEYGKQQYRSAFRYPGKVLMEGTPRNDQLVCPDPVRQQQIRQQLNIPNGKKLLLYAPTLRREQQKSGEAQRVQSLNLSAALTALENKTGDDWICMLRAHPSITALTGAGEDGRIIDASSYEDMADLLLAADMLITDYSSCAGDFALTGKPVVLYQADRQEYLEKDRTFYFDIADSPYMVAENQQGLERIIAELTEEKTAQNCRDILEFYGDCETGHASEAVAKIICEWIDR